MKLKERLKLFLPVCIIGVIYLCTFSYLEGRRVPIHIIQGKIDSMIPFCEYFIVPYLLWFVYVAATVGYFLFFVSDKEEYKRLCISLLTGMIVFVVISYIFPNGQILRPNLAGENIFQILVMHLYKTDTPTNILPSLHVFYSIACCVALLKNDRVKRSFPTLSLILLLTVSIVLSTMFLKQHSIIDVVMAFVLNILCYQLFYKEELANVIKVKNTNPGTGHKRKGIEL